MMGPICLAEDFNWKNVMTLADAPHVQNKDSRPGHKIKIRSDPMILVTRDTMRQPLVRTVDFVK